MASTSKLPMLAYADGTTGIDEHHGSWKRLADDLHGAHGAFRGAAARPQPRSTCT